MRSCSQESSHSMFTGFNRKPSFSRLLSLMLNLHSVDQQRMWRSFHMIMLHVHPSACVQRRPHLSHLWSFRRFRSQLLNHKFDIHAPISPVTRTIARVQICVFSLRLVIQLPQKFTFTQSCHLVAMAVHSFLPMIHELEMQMTAVGKTKYTHKCSKLLFVLRYGLVFLLGSQISLAEAIYYKLM